MSTANIKRVCEDTIKGEDLPTAHLEVLAKSLGFRSNERLELIYINLGNFTRSLSIKSDIVVGLTNLRIFRTENGHLTYSLIEDIVSVEHEQNSIFRWDTLRIRLKRGDTQAFGIYFNQTCAYFCKTLCTMLEPLEAESAIKTNHPRSDIAPNSNTPDPASLPIPSQESLIPSLDVPLYPPDPVSLEIPSPQSLISSPNAPLYPPMHVESREKFVAARLTEMELSNLQGSQPLVSGGQREYIYVLLLNSESDPKYYVGKTGDLVIRIADHSNRKGSSWTSLYKPIKVIGLSFCNSMFDEDTMTKEYMMQYGISNVRGGSYVSKNLSQRQVISLLKEFLGMTDRCFKCGREGHFAAQCYAKSWCCFYCPGLQNPHTDSKCTRCGLINPNFRYTRSEEPYYENNRYEQKDDKSCSLM